jgi:hypothetical protein
MVCSKLSLSRSIRVRERRPWVVVATVAVFLSTAYWPARGQEIAALSEADFVIHGVEQGSDTLAVRDLLGQPDSTSAVTLELWPAPHKLVRWIYPAMVLEVTEMGLVNAVILTDVGVETRRGLRVGESGAHVRRLYGSPTVEAMGLWLYEDPADAFRVIAVRFDDSRVIEIRLGNVSILIGE